MLNKIIRPEFTGAAAQIRAQQLLAAMPRGLGVVRHDPAWVNEWEYKIGQSPKTFYETLCRDIDGDVQAFIDFFDLSEPNFTVDIAKKGRTVFKTENILTSDGTGKTLRFKSWVNEDPDSRGRGMGLNLFRNMFDNAQAGGIDFITLRGGKEDGRHFWPAHGFYYASALYHDRAVGDIAENVKKYSDTIPGGILIKIREIIDQGGLDMAWKLARLPGTVLINDKVKPLGWALLHTPGESEYRIDMHDEEQVARVRDSFVRKLPTMGRQAAPSLLP